MSINVLFAAGGTGGHIFPAIAVMEELQKRHMETMNVHWLGSSDRMEATIIPDRGIPFTPMPIKGFRRLASVATLLLPVRIAGSVLKARTCMQAFHPDVVIVTGAYISYPAGVAARQLGVPLVVMESNVNLGKTNRQLVPGAALIILTYEESLAQLSDGDRARAHVLGNPVRAGIRRGGDAASTRAFFDLRADLPTVLVIGGSLGARSINTCVQGMVLDWASEGKAPYQLIWQTGAQYHASIPDEVASMVRVVTFVERMDMAYAAADLVVGRSGATTVAELGVTGKPAVLVPLPSASMGEQYLNAKVTSDRGGAVLVHDGDLASQLATIIVDLIEHPDRLKRMAVSMAAMGRPDATERVADQIDALILGVS